MKIDIIEHHNCLVCDDYDYNDSASDVVVCLRGRACVRACLHDCMQKRTEHLIEIIVLRREYQQTREVMTYNTYKCARLC